jgi:hypothetical protein
MHIAPSNALLWQFALSTSTNWQKFLPFGLSPERLPNIMPIGAWKTLKKRFYPLVPA